MKKTEQGFSVVEIVLVLVIVGIFGWIGYRLYQANYKPGTANNAVNSTVTSATPSNAVAPAQPAAIPAPLDTAQTIDNLAGNDASSEASIDSSFTDGEQSVASTPDNAANDLGGAYDESSL